MKINLSQCKEDSDAANRRERALLFTIEDTRRTIDDLITEFKQDITDLTDEELIQLKSDMTIKSNQIDGIARKYQSILESPIKNSNKMFEITTLGEMYDLLIQSKSTFTKSLNSVLEKRDVYKQRLFSESKLNIQIEKFSGYDDPVDFYTFKQNFNKVHQRSTPRHLLADLMKNNYLKEPALSVVKTLTDIDDIWARLQFTYGDVMIMLNKKLKQLSITDPLHRMKDPEATATAISRIINLLKELSSLAEVHDIEHHLYYGGGINKVYCLLGDARLSRWLTSIANEQLSPKEEWKKLVEFLEADMKIQQQKTLIMKYSMEQAGSRKQQDGPKELSRPPRNQRYGHYSSSPSIPSDPICFICDAKNGCHDHVSTPGPGGIKIIQYYTCRKFAEMTPAERFLSLKNKGYCFQCLFPGAVQSHGKHKDGKCQHDFICPNESHKKYQLKKHVLVCEEHKEHQANKEVLEKFKLRCMRSTSIPDFSRNIKLSFHLNSYTSNVSTSRNDSINDRGVYLLQTITVNGNRLNLFYDNGCSDFILSKKAVVLLGSSAIKLSNESVNLGGVGNSITKSSGSYCVTLPLHDERKITMSGVCLDKITANFPFYPLADIEKEISNDYRSAGGNMELPRLPPAVGGEIHLMIGVKYLRYHPKLVHQLESGLSIYESSFVNSDGGRGVVGGPHKIFTEIHNSFFNSSNPLAYFIRGSHHQSNDVPLLGYHDNYPLFNYAFSNPIQSNLSKQQQLFEKVESTGCEISYRCPTCRTCKECKHHDEYESISLKEEIEQNIINSSVKVNLEDSSTTASLPFISDPKRLTNNKDKAMKVYNQQLRKLNLLPNAKDKKDILVSEQKLQDLGFVDYLDNMPQDIQEKLRYHSIQYYIPWRAVWKGNSVSTPCRIVFDASQPTSSGYSLNDLLAKGRNNLNRLQEIIIRWSMFHVGIHTDIRKMYNTIKLNKSDWCYQRYLWEPNLDPTKVPQEKIIKTLIYGVRSSGNQAEYGLRKTGELLQEQYPHVNQVVRNDVYVDDCITGEHNIQSAHKLADDLEMVLNKGGFQLKGVSFSGEDPLDKLTDDGETIHVAGMKWFPKNDTLTLNIDKLNFARRCRGKKPLDTVNIIPSKLTRRHCSSKVAEIFDLTGKVAPIVASMKIDLQELVRMKLDWDDPIPNDLRPLWESNFEMIKEIGNLHYKRAVVPQDAVNLDIQTLEFGDASQSMICACVYARFKRRNGRYSCQLVLARTRCVPEGMTLPRAELYAALLNTYTGQIVQRSFKDHHKCSFKFTDSQVTLFWITNEKKTLKQWVRNRVIEIKRFTTTNQWSYVQSDYMIADIGTRRGASLKDVSQDSVWINGYPWMQLHHTKFPTLTPDEIKLDINDTNAREASKEIQAHLSKIDDQVKSRYVFSDYITDPNRHSFQKVVRILAYVIRFCHHLLHVRLNKINHERLITNEEIKEAENYFYQIGTREIYQFLPPEKYNKFTSKNGILYYTGRILPEDQVTIVGKFTSVMKDLSNDSFCVPVLDKNSPIAYSIALDIHWNHPVCKHSGVEITLRYVLKKVYIIEGRSLIKLIRKNCQRCRFLLKRSLEVVMGPVSDCNLTIAPAFYATQIDLSGPYASYSPTHKRKVVKIWLTVFCCCTTSAISIKVMDDYSTDSFIQSFTRFACDNGFPKKVFCDSGSQIVSACENVKFNFSDIQSKLHRNQSVEFSICPVGGHNMHGKVERKIQEINKSISKVMYGERLSLLQWETLSAVIANNINDLPISVGNKTDIENMDLITPNRLLLGRNNDRSPIGCMDTMSKPSKIMQENERIYSAWFESWLINHVPHLMNQQKWYKGDQSIEIGDVVLFKKSDSSISKTYQYGIISKVEYSKDKVVRKVLVRYCNANEKSCRETYRSVRELVLIRSADEFDLIEELAESARL